jgi:hypothetical protein
MTYLKKWISMQQTIIYSVASIAIFIIILDIVLHQIKKRKQMAKVKKGITISVVPQMEVENTITEREVELGIAHLVDMAEKCDHEVEHGLADALKAGFVNEAKVAEYRNFKKGESHGLHIAVNMLNHILHHNQNFDDIEQG